MYYSYRLCIVLIGFILYVQLSMVFVMLIMEWIEERIYGNLKMYYLMSGFVFNNWFFYKEVYDMDMFKVVDMIVIIQQYVDQGISFILFLKDIMMICDLNWIDLYVYYRGIKIIYYVRMKDIG